VKTKPWTTREQVAVGVALLTLLTRVAPQHFGVELRFTAKNKQTYVLTLAPETRDMLNDLEDRAAVARPLLLPMRIPPNPWRRV
jgi:hypothetical protein